MKNRTVFVSLLLLLAGYVVSFAQQSPHSYPRKTGKIFRHQQEKSDDLFHQEQLSWQASALTTYSKDNQNMTNAIIPDFQVNENAGPKGAYQGYPAIASDHNGNFVVTWMDERNGDSDIYAQRYASDGSPIGANFRVNDDLGSVNQNKPAICSDPNGNFVITWSDDRHGDDAVYFQRYNNKGIPLDTNFRNINEPPYRDQTEPSISSDDQGNFVITWKSYTAIYAQRYDSIGYPLGNNIRVTSVFGSHGARSPTISVNSYGEFVITWHEDRNGNLDIFAQRFASNGRTRGSNFRINDDQGTATQWYPAVTLDDSAKFVITWGDGRSGSNIYAQRLASSGYTLGTNFRVNDDQTSAWQGYPAISSRGYGNFVITWEDGRNGDDDIYAQRFTQDCSPLGPNFKISDDPAAAPQWYPAISTDGSGHFVIAWEDWRNRNADIYLQRCTLDGTLLGTNIKVNDDQGSAWQTHSSISVDGNGNFVIAWMDERFGEFDVFAQQFYSDASPRGHNFQVNDEQADVLQEFPAISTDANGNFVITWIDERQGDPDIYAQRFAISGGRSGSNFRVNDDLGSARQDNPAISSDDSGNFVITWEDGRNGPHDIYAQRYGFDGGQVGTNMIINDDGGTFWHREPSICSNGNGNFVITWEDHRNRYRDIYAQRLSGDGNLAGSNFKVNGDPGSARQYRPAICIDAGGNFVIAWNGFYDVYAQRFASDGSPLGVNFRVNDDYNDLFNAKQGPPSISSDGSGNFIITWYDERNRDRYEMVIYGQRYRNDGSLLSHNFKLTNSSLKHQFYPDVKLWNGRIYNTWTDARAGGSGYDIWANVLDWDKPVQKTVPNNYLLYQNYPNPFNLGTTIEFYLPSAGMTTLTIYNILGEEIATPIASSLHSGFHWVNWSGSASIASGVYIYRLKAGGFIDIKKMVLMK